MRSPLFSAVPLLLVIFCLDFARAGSSTGHLTPFSRNSRTRFQHLATTAKTKRKIRLDFASASSSLSPSGGGSDFDPLSATPTESSTHKSHSPITSRPDSPAKVKKTDSGFSNELELGFSNSAYRYAGEEFPNQTFDYSLAPSYKTKCFSVDCSFGGKVAGSFNMNQSNKHIGDTLQVSLDFKPSKWAGLWAPKYTLKSNLPARPREFADQMAFAYGVGFGLGTTPELLGTKVIGFSGSADFVKNEYKGPIVSQADWSSRQALTTNFNFTEEISATVIFANIWVSKYDNTDLQIVQMIQSLNWSALDWLELSVGHNNTGPLYSDAGSRIDPSLVSIDNSVISIGATIKNSF
jgi:hypothetical protein